MCFYHEEKYDYILTYINQILNSNLFSIHVLLYFFCVLPSRQTIWDASVSILLSKPLVGICTMLSAATPANLLRE